MYDYLTINFSGGTYMNVTNLKENYQNLLSFMAEKGYKESTINGYRHQIQWILDHEENRKWTSYKDIYLEYASYGYSYNWLRGKKALLGTLERFDLYGEYPDGKHHYPFFARNAYDLLLPDFKRIIDFYKDAQSKSNLRPSTLNNRFCSASRFFYYLQNNGCCSLADVTEEMVQSFFTPGSNCTRGHDYIQRVRAVLMVCLPSEPFPIKNILNYLPAIQSFRKNVPVLKPEEISAVKELLRNPDGRISLRDRAIGVLALYTGLRSIDIINLEFSAIDWEQDRLRLTQQKTRVPIEIPLSAMVGNALYDYITEERPGLDDPHVFLTTDKPYRPLRCVYQASRHIFRAVGLRQTPGTRKGLHLFRHHMATEMLEKKVPQPVISRALGHTSPCSLTPYLHTDFTHLKECALSIARFPVSEEVFGA